MPGATPRSIQHIYADVQTCTKRVQRLNEHHKEMYMQNAPPVGLRQIEDAMALIHQDVAALHTCHFTQLQSLINDSDCLIAACLRPILNDLLHVANWYSTTLLQSFPRDPRLRYGSLYGEEREKLQSLNIELDRLVGETLNDGERPLAAHIIQEHHPSKFCSGSIQLLNGKDEGRAIPVWRKEDIKTLSEAQQSKLENGRCGYMFWKCTTCHFRIKYEVDESESSTILKTGELRSSGNIAYRSAFLAKSHLHHKNSATSHKYGCLFCFARGLPLDPQRSTAFKSSKDLLKHLQSEHALNEPHPIVTERVKTVFGETESRPGSYDLRFLGILRD